MVVSFVDEMVECAHLFGADTGCVFAELDEYLAAVRDWVGVGLAFFERGVFGFHGFGGDGGDCHSIAAEDQMSDKILSDLIWGDTYLGYPFGPPNLFAKSWRSIFNSSSDIS